MIRSLSMFASIASLLLFVCSAAVCVRSQFRSDNVIRVLSSDDDGTAAGREESARTRAPWWAGDHPIWYDERRVYSDRRDIVFDHQRLAADNLGGFIPPRGWYYNVEEADEAQVHLWPTYAGSGSFTPSIPDRNGVQGSATLTLPHWLLLCVFAILPSVTITRAIRKHARPSGTCRKCGYDLRASKERCPECGTPVTQNLEAKS